MPVAIRASRIAPIDLESSPAFSAEADRLRRFSIDPAYVRAVEALGEVEAVGPRVRRLVNVFHTLNSWESAHLLMAAAKLSLHGDAAGQRVLFGFMTVKPPGVEVLRALQPLTNLERVSLRLVSGTWKEPEQADGENPAFPILELLGEGTRLGILDLGIEALPARPTAVRATTDHLRRWFGWLTDRLAKGGRLPAELITFLVQLCMLEIALMEKRISRLAESIDPYDMRGMGRLMPVLSRYDQEIEHMKNVVGQVVTYRPFSGRALTVEEAIDKGELNRIQRELEQHPVGAAVGRIVAGVRANPVLDRQLLTVVSAVHQIATLRAELLPRTHAPDLLSTLAEVLRHYRENAPARVCVEPDVAAELWPTVVTWGMVRRWKEGFRLDYREERSIAFVNPDGTPRLPDVPSAHEPPQLSVEELVRIQLGNEPFLLGILDNAKVTSRTRVVPIIATLSRSVRVLEKICRSRHLYSGPANKDVPRLLLTNPARIPVGSLRLLIHVRYVTRLELERLAGQKSTLRPEVRQEIATYLRSITR